MTYIIQVHIVFSSVTLVKIRTIHVYIYKLIHVLYYDNG